MKGGALQRAERLLESDATRLLLSLLIILSILPSATLADILPPVTLSLLDAMFLAVFTPEFVLRCTVFARRLREGRSTRGEALLLLADLVALTTFLPLHLYALDPGVLRLFRLTRLLLLFGYWGGLLRDLGRIVVGRERRSQVLLVLLLGVVLSFAGAVVLQHFAPGYDYDDDGRVDASDHAFLPILWWSFRQVQDAGNLVSRPSDVLVVGVSLGLTFAGVILFSFLIGIATGAMDELMRRTRDRPVGLRDHTVILGLGAYSDRLVDELAQIYRKNLKVPRVAVLGAEEATPDFLQAPELATFHYRSGSSERVDTLERVDVAAAKRVLVQGARTPDADAQAVSTVLAVRTQTTSASVFVDLEHEKNFAAARMAGGPRTHLIGWGPLLGCYLSQNVVYPGLYRAYRELLTPEGCEIYTYMFDAAEHAEAASRMAGGALDVRALTARAFEEGVGLIGLFLSHDEHPMTDHAAEDLVLNPAAPGAPGLHPGAFDGAGVVRWDAVRGVIGVCERWKDVADFARGLVRDGMPAGSAPGLARLPDGLQFDLPAPRLERVLICGGSSRVPRVLSELMRFYGHLEVTILVRDEEVVAPLAYDIEAALEGWLSGMPADGASRWKVEERADGREMNVRGGAGESRIRVLNLDWGDATRLLRHPAAALERTDAVFFLPRENSDEVDGLVALATLRLAQFASSEGVHLPPGLRVLGLMSDPVKSDLLERRLDGVSGPGAETRFTIISSERLRHHFLVQNLFVRGLNSVYLDLLGVEGQHLCRLVPRWSGPPADGDVDAAELAQALQDAARLVLVAFEVDCGRGRPVMRLGPRAMSRARIAWRDLRAIYAVGDVIPPRG